MNKEKLIKVMREAAIIKAGVYQPDINMIDRVFDKYGTACAEAALKHMPQWVKVEDAKLYHRQPLWIKAKEFNYAIHGYYNEIIGVFHAYENPEFDGHRHIVTDVLPINLPEPPKE